MDQLEDMEINRFLDLLQFVLKRLKDEHRETLIEGAFIGWQIQEIVKGLSDKAKPQTFNDYVKRLGLEEKKKTDSKPISKDEALKNAKDIINLDKQR